MFYDALVPHGFEFAGGFEIDPRGARDLAHRVDVIHFHWPEEIWRREVAGRIARVGAILRLRRFLGQVRRLGVTACWTVHNLEPHERAHWTDRLGHTLLAWQCDLLICHSRHAVDDVVRKYRVPKRRILHMPHGAYLDRFPVPRPQQAVRVELGLDPHLPTVAMTGQMRPYKGIDLAVEALSTLPDVQFILAGRVNLKRSVVDQARNELKGRIAVIERQLDDQEFADLTAAADVVLLPYRNITGSGALLAALSLARPVVASDLPYFREVLSARPTAGWLFESGNARSMATAIRHVLSSDPQECGRQALAIAEENRWENVIAPVADCMAHLVRQNRGAA
jgi:glycosyltransferase involved in cell wall biosynthesis